VECFKVKNNKQIYCGTWRSGVPPGCAVIEFAKNILNSGTTTTWGVAAVVQE